MFRFAALLLALTVSSPDVARSQGQDRPVRTGTYDLTLVFGGGNLPATLDIGYKGDTVTATLKLSEHQSPVRAGKRTGNKLTLEPTSPAMDVRYELEFNADDVKGTFTFNGQDGTLTGKRRRSGT